MNSDPTSQNSRNTRLDVRGLLRIVLGAILVLVTPAWLAVAAYEYSQPTASATSLVSPVVEIRDETSSFQSVDGRPLSVALEGIGFLRPIHLVVLSTDNLTGDNLDEATLKYARAKHPEWIARNGYKWADGYFILAVSPAHRQVGTYFGEDIAPTLSIQSEIQDAAKDDFREGRWSQGVVAAVSTAASIMPNEAGMSLENRPVWPDWKGALATLAGIGILARGNSLHRRVRENANKIAEEWQALEGRRGEVERAFVALLEAGDYTSGLSARYESARAEYERVRERIAQTQSTHFLGTLSAQASNETDEILEDLHALADADHAIVAAGDFFALRPGWRAIWDNEVGPIFEDLQAVDNVGVTVRDHVKNPKVHGATKSLFQWTNEQRALLLGLGTRLERAEVTPAQALEELDRIANESRTRLADVVTSALALDSSTEGRQRYARWQSPPAELVNAAEMFYKGSYLSQGATHEYNPASTIRLTANSAGVNLAAYRANTSSRFKDYDSYIYVRPLYLDEYVISSGATSSSTSSANYGSSSGGFSGSGSSSSF